MFNRKIFLSGLSILSALSLMAGATFAFFSDSGTSTGNVFATGTLILKLTDSNQSDQDSVELSFGSGALVPGSCTGVQTLTLKNTGTVAANHAEVTVANTITDTNGDADPDMDSYLKINSLTYDGGDVMSQITNSNSTLFKDLNDWAAGTGLDNLGLTDLSIGHPLAMDICLDGSAPNEIQADQVSSLFTVTLNQDSSQ